MRCPIAEISLRRSIFAPRIYTQPGWSYRPWCVIPTNNLFVHLWIRPRNCHYYYGNYYGPQYSNWGLHSWCNYPGRRYHYDPFYHYARVHYRRQGIDYIGRCQNWHDYYARHADHRPPRTWREQQQHIDRHHDGRHEGRHDDHDRHDHRNEVHAQLLARNLEDVARRDDGPVRLARLDSASRQALVERTEKLRELNTTRKKVELRCGAGCGSPSRR